MGDFAKAHAFTARWEGGFTDHPADPGGVTNHGVSLRFLRGQKEDIDGDGDIDGDDVRALGAEDAARIMRREFWDPMKLDEVKPLCAAVIYDTAVNMGAGCARRMTQKVLGVPADGVWGPVTWSALRICDDRKTAAAICHIRRARYHELAGRNAALGAFLRGWLRRVDALETFVETERDADAGTSVRRTSGVRRARRAVAREEKAS